MATAPASEGVAEVAINEICESPGLHAEAVEISKDLERLCAGAGEGHVRAVLAKIALRWPPRLDDARMLPEFYRPYVTALKGYPREALDYAVEKYIRDAKMPVFPLLSEIERLAKPIAQPMFVARYRIAEAARRPPVRKVTPEEAAANREAVRRIMADRRAGLPPAPEPTKPGERSLSVAERQKLRAEGRL